jgi:hypothetical protein
MSKCTSCIAGPKGVEGHMDLFVFTMSGGPMQFKCRTCGALWMRRQSGDHMKWTDAVGDELGATLPQAARSND